MMTTLMGTLLTSSALEVLQMTQNDFICNTIFRIGRTRLTNVSQNWGILKQVFRGNIPDHGDIVHAVDVITDISIMRGDKLFSFDYHNPPYNTEDGNGNGDEDEGEGLSYETEDISLYWNEVDDAEVFINTYQLCSFISTSINI